MSANLQTTASQLTGIIDVFIDPESVTKRLGSPSAWLIPLALVGVCGVIVGLAIMPITLQVVRNSLPPGFTEEQVFTTLQRVESYQRFGVFLSPAFLPIKWALLAGILYMSCILLDVRATFKSLFTLIAQCSLINLLEMLTTYGILSLKRDEIQTVADLSPKLGLDLFVSVSSKPLLVLVNYLSVFNIWYVVILSLGLAYLSGCSKGKAFAATSLVWLLPLGIGVGMALISK